MFYLRYALRALRRSGQRTLLVIISVVFGVMALVTMQLLSDIITGALLGEPRVMRGGDLTIDHETDTYLSEADFDQLEALQASGRIEAYTLIARTFTMLIKPENGTKTGFVMYAQGVEPDIFPLIGKVTMHTPQGSDLAAVIRSPGHIAITRDMAADLALKVGDTVRVTDGLDGAPQRMIIGGIIEMLPDHMAKSVLCLVFALIALFVGVVAIGFSVATIRAAEKAVNDRLGSLEGSNLVLFGSMDQDIAIQAQMTQSSCGDDAAMQDETLLADRS